MTQPALQRPGAALSFDPPARTRVVAHRGASARAPENTLSAVRAALACGADAVEIDVRRSRDGAFVVIHDARVGRTTDARTPRWRRSGPRVEDLTLAELRRLDAGAWKSSSFIGERIPTLDEVLHLLAPTRAHLLVEIKRPAGSRTGDLARLAAVLTNGPLPHQRLTVQSFDAPVVRRLRELLPRVTLAVLARSLHADVATLSRWADQVTLNHRSADRRTVDTLHGWNLRCVTWTVNDAAAMWRMLELGVDGIITDHPERLLAALGRVPAGEGADGARLLH